MKALVPLAEGFEELEAVTIVDVLRRGGVEVTLAALAKSPVKGSHGIVVQADAELDAVDAATFDAVVLPGGPAAKRLRDDARVRAIVRKVAQRGKVVAAVCAAPIALEAAGVLAGKHATVYPGNELPSAKLIDGRTVVDGNVVTGQGPGTALEFSLMLLGLLVGEEKAMAVARAMLAD